MCWVMGFKPRGDDARPDRGLPPLIRMLVGPATDLLTIVYGPAPQDTWPMLLSDPVALGGRNGLWESVFATSDALLIDSATDKVTKHGFLKEHWAPLAQTAAVPALSVFPSPVRIGEQDVDTALHLLLTHFSNETVFEGMCNPPGGDWSGISVLTPDQGLELRWLSLPRVSGSGAKRPDHVFQFLGIERLPIVLAVESKETAAAVESGIGPRLKRYLADLLASPASISRPNAATLWEHSDALLDLTAYSFASAVAFLPTGSKDMLNVVEKTQTDLVIGCTFDEVTQICHMQILASTPVGREIAAAMASMSNPLVSVVVA